MTFLAKAKEHSKKKKHPAAESEAPASSGPEPDEEPSGAAQSADSEDQGDEGGEGEDPAPSATPGAGPGAGGTPDAPQAGANQPTQQGSDQGNSGDSEGDDSDQDQSASGGAQGDQGGAPSGDDSADDSSQAQGGQDPGDPTPAQASQAAQAAGGDLQEFKNAVGPDGEPDFSKIPLPPALSEELDKAKAALSQALYQNEKVARAILQSVVPGQQLPAAAAHMTLVVVSSINKQLMFSKNAPQLVLPITQLTLNHILDMVEQVRKVQVPDNQAVGALGLAQEGVMRMFGVSKQQVANLKSHLPPSMVSKYQAHYKNAHAFATQGQQQGGPQGGGAPGASAGQAGATPPTDASSPAGAAQGGGGGMVSQGAQAAQGAPSGGAEPSGPSQEEQEEQE